MSDLFLNVPAVRKSFNPVDLHIMDMFYMYHDLVNETPLTPESTLADLLEPWAFKKYMYYDTGFMNAHSDIYEPTMPLDETPLSSYVPIHEREWAQTKLSNGARLAKRSDFHSNLLSIFGVRPELHNLTDEDLMNHIDRLIKGAYYLDMAKSKTWSWPRRAAVPFYQGNDIKMPVANGIVNVDHETDKYIEFIDVDPMNDRKVSLKYYKDNLTAYPTRTLIPHQRNYLSDTALSVEFSTSLAKIVASVMKTGDIKFTFNYHSGEHNQTILTKIMCDSRWFMDAIENEKMHLNIIEDGICIRANSNYLVYKFYGGFNNQHPSLAARGVAFTGADPNMVTMVCKLPPDLWDTFYEHFQIGAYSHPGILTTGTRMYGPQLYGAPGETIRVMDDAPIRNTPPETLDKPRPRLLASKIKLIINGVAEDGIVSSEYPEEDANGRYYILVNRNSGYSPKAYVAWLPAFDSYVAYAVGEVPNGSKLGYFNDNALSNGECIALRYRDENYIYIADMKKLV